MQISSRANRRPSPQSIGILLCLALTCATAVAPAAAQTLARPNWAGSGMSAEAWWRTAVFYRINVASFQDSDGNGVGDLRGIAQRLDYLQSLGVDALVLEPPFDETGFDDLLREASRRHVRLAVAISLAGHRSIPAIVTEARGWLTRGVAGLDVIPALNSSGTTASFDAASMRALRALTDSFPGQRVLLAERVSGTDLAPAPDDGHQAQLEDAEVNFVSPDGLGGFAPNLRRALTHAQEGLAATEPWLVTDDGYRSALAYDYAGDPARTLGTRKIIATMLFAARGAIDLLFGQEIGLPALDLAATMQWTPSNITRPKLSPKLEPTVDPKPAPREDVFGAYKPYVAPKPPAPILSLAPAFDPDALEGFTTAHLPANPTPRAPNVAEQDRDPQSLLNFYRRLGQLHHGSPTLRTGAMHVLNRDDAEALVWVRRAPTSARTAASLVIACNLGPKPLTLNLRDDLERLHMRASALRPLLASWTTTPSQTQTADHIELPAYTVFIGELAPR